MQLHINFFKPCKDNNCNIKSSMLLYKIPNRWPAPPYIHKYNIRNVNQKPSLKIHQTISQNF